MGAAITDGREKRPDTDEKIQRAIIYWLPDHKGSLKYFRAADTWKLTLLDYNDGSGNDKLT